MSYDAVPSERSESCHYSKATKSVDIPIKSITQRRMERNDELRHYKRKLIAHVEKELDKEIQKCKPIGVNLYIYSLTGVWGYNVSESEIIEILKNYYEPEYIVSVRPSGIGNIVVIVENPKAKSSVYTKRPGHDCVLL